MGTCTDFIFYFVFGGLAVTSFYVGFRLVSMFIDYRRSLKKDALYIRTAYYTPTIERFGRPTQAAANYNYRAGVYAARQ